MRINALLQKAVLSVCSSVCHTRVPAGTPTFQLLELVWQHILGVVSNVLYCFVGNLTSFPAVKKENRLSFDEIIVTIRWRVFLDTVYIVRT